MALNPIPLLLGTLLLALSILDLLWTTIWVEGGAGPLTTRVMSGTWRLMRRLSGPRKRLLNLAGPVVLILGLVLWISLLWVGWTLVFSGVEVSLVDTRDPGPVSLVERFYFVGYSMFTMGNGDFTPNGSLWQIMTSLTTASGMLFVTLIVSYVVSVLDAVTQKRALANNISGLGNGGAEIVRTAWDGDSFGSFELQLNSISSDITELTTNHQAYPILHYFYTDKRDFAAAPSMAALDEALTILRFGVPESDRPGQSVLASTRASVEDYLQTVISSFVPIADETPPEPDFEGVRTDGVPAESAQQFAEALDSVAERRRRLLGLVEADAHDWPPSSGQ